MAFVEVGLALGASEAFAGIVGSAAVGAAVGGGYSALTGDGNVLNSALTGAAIGGTFGAMAPTAGFNAATAAAPSTALAPTSNVITQVPTASLTSANPAALDALAASKGVFAEGSSMLPGAGLNAAPPVISPGAADLTSQISSANLAKDPIGALNASQGWTDSWNPAWDTVAKEKAAGLTGKEMLGYGLAGTAALSLLGGMNQPKISSTAGTSPSYIRPYTYSQTRNPNWGQPGQPYYSKQTYTAGTPYKAAAGGLMSIGGPVERMSQVNAGQGTYPQAFLDHATYATPSQMPTSAEVVASDYDTKTSPYTGDITRMAEGGQAQDPNQFINMYNQLQASNPAPTRVVNPDVAAYQNLLNERSRAEYVNGPQLAAFRAAPPVAAAPAVEKPETPEITPDIKGLYQYYLGRQPTAEEIPQWAGMINGPVTPDMANYFSQFTGGELAKTGYKPKGPNPFLGGDIGSNRLLPITQNVDPTGMTGTLNADLVNMGAPQSAGLGSVGLNRYQYDPVTKGYTKMRKGGEAEDDDFSSALSNVSLSKTDMSLLRKLAAMDKSEMDEEERKKLMFDFFGGPLTQRQMPGANVGSQNAVEKHMMTQAPQGMFGRIGARKELDDRSTIRAGASGTAMAIPGKHGIAAMPQAFDIGYTSPRKSDWDPYVDVNAFRSINPIPGGGHAQGLNARYTVPFVAGGQTGYNLGGYSDGGRLLKGPGDGMSDNIPATIGNRQPARLADGEFVVPADVVSHLGNGSTDAGAKKLYAMMDKVRQARTGTKKQGKQIKAEKYLKT